MSTRTTVLWVPDWPVVAAATVEAVPTHLPAAVHDGRRLTAVSALARAEGVRRGMRRRQAQSACPELVLLPADDARDVRLFEPVAAAAESVVAGVEVARPGLLLLPAGGAGRYHGSEAVLAERLVDAVAQSCGHECGVGTADGLLAAVLAARTGVAVPPGTSAQFLARRAVRDLLHAAVTDEAAAAVADLVHLLNRLGLRVLGQLAALPATDVHARFGPLGSWAWTLARGEDLRPPARRRPEAELTVTADLDPPLERVDTVTFVGRRLAEDLHDQLVQRSVACGRLQIAAHTEDGDELVRTWRTDLGGWGGLTPARITDRIRWQLEGWLTAVSVRTARSRAGDAAPAGGSRRRGEGRADEDVSVEGWPGDHVDDERPVALVRLTVTALDVAPAGAEQGRLWGGPSGGDLRAHRALDRVQSVVGGQGVLVAALQGGRDVREQVHLRTWGEQTEPPRPLDRPWPGRLPEPAPASVLDPAVPVEVRDGTGTPVLLDLRRGLSGDPVTVGWYRSDDGREPGAGDREPRPSGRRRRRGVTGTVAGHEDEGVRDAPEAVRTVVGVRTVAGWAGPWVTSGRWWAVDDESPERSGPRAHVQVTLEDGRALLLVCTADGWVCEGSYD